MVSGLLDLFEATHTVQWLQWAEKLQNRQDQLFWDAQGNGYFCSDPLDPTILLSLKQGEKIHTLSYNAVPQTGLDTLLLI